MENEFPPNSHTDRAARSTRTVEKAPEKQEITRVTRSKAIQRKKPLHRKFFEAFRPEDARGFVEYVVLDVFVTGLKDVVADATISTVENALGVDGRSRARSRYRGSSSGGRTEYNRMSGSRPRDRGRDDDRRDRRREPSRSSADFTEIVLPTRVEAEEVLETMYEILGKYEAVTRRDLLGLSGEDHVTTDEDWGWTDLRGARVHKVREGYLIDLPRPEYLD